MTLRLALLASGLMFTAACDGSSKDDSSANGDDGSGDDGKGDDGKGDDGTPGGDAGPGGDGGGPGGDGGGPGGGDGGGPGGGDAGPGGDAGGDGTWNGVFATWLSNFDTKNGCVDGWWATSGTESSATCPGCDFTYDLDATYDYDPAKSCFGVEYKDFSYINGHVSNYGGSGYDMMMFSYDGTNWGPIGYVYKAGGGFILYNGYTTAYYPYNGGRYYYAYFGYGYY
jgi:hypothetical protein